MKRELAFALEVRSQLEDSLGHTRSETVAVSRPSSYLDDDDDDSARSKRFKGSVVNGLIVYTRGRRPHINVFSGLLESENKNKCNTAAEREILGSLAVGEVQIQTVGSVCKKESDGVVEKASDKEGMAEVEGSLPGWGVKRFTRSSLRPKAEPEPEDGLPITVGFVKEEVVSDVGGEASETVNSLSNPANKLELKMSKKIALNKRPMTVKELFDTGLLDGVPVIYMGVKKVVANSGNWVHFCAAF